MTDWQPLRTCIDDIPPPSWGERIGVFVPLFGWIYASAAHSCRVQPFVESVRDELLQRDATTRECWRGGPHSEGFSLYLCKLVGDAYDWPNDFFVPDDPCNLLFFNDDMEISEVMMAVEDELGLPAGTIDESFLPRAWDMTLGELSDTLLAFADDDSQHEAGMEEHPTDPRADWTPPQWRIIDLLAFTALIAISVGALAGSLSPVVILMLDLIALLYFVAWLVAPQFGKRYRIGCEGYLMWALWLFVLNSAFMTGR